MRPLLLSLCFLTACGGLSHEEERDLYRYQSQALLYWEGNKLDQAMDQVQRGLAIAPDDYKLNSLKGGILLRVGSAGGSGALRRLQEAEETLTRVYATRDPARHQPHLLLNYALTLQKLGMVNQDEAQRLREVADRSEPNSADALAARAKAAEHEAIGRSKLLRSREVLAALLARGDSKRDALFHSMQIAIRLGENELALEHGKAYLEANRTDQQWQQAEISRTSVLAYEQERRAALQALRQDELVTRSTLAEMLYQAGRHEQAVEHLDIVLQLDPGRSADYYNRARCLMALGRTEAAKADYRTFMQTSNLPATHPRMTEAVRALESR